MAALFYRYIYLMLKAAAYYLFVKDGIFTFAIKYWIVFQLKFTSDLSDLRKNTFVIRWSVQQ